MVKAQQLRYLQAMGIDVWLPRAQDETEHANARSDDQTSHIEVSAPETTGAAPTAAADGFTDTDWTALRAQVAACTACGLHKTRKQTVFGVGDANAAWMIVGEAPGAEEDRQGEPFVGRAGQLLNTMLAAIGLKREQVFIANILKCRPPGNRDPRPEEAAACEHFLLTQLAMVRPKLILALGRVAAQNLLRSTMPLGRLRGRRHSYTGIPLIATYHPAYLLRSPAGKRKAWEDLLFARSIAREPGPSDAA